MNLRQGTLLKHGEYRIERELGHGGFGITYLGVQLGLNRRVAIKEFFMREYCNRDADTSQVSVPSNGSKELVSRFKNKFIKEAQTIACLKHPHIISIYDVFEDNGTAYYVMEYLDHGSLAKIVKQQGRLSEADSLRYIRQIADALHYIHTRRMNHLDVKPSNILIDEIDHAILIDFGLSKRYNDEGKQTSTTPVGISHGYAPLEQYKKSGVGTFSPATDIYSLGATLYKLIIGDTPPEADVIIEEGFPPLPSYVSPSVASAIQRAMQPLRKDRPQSIEAFLALLEEEPTTIDFEQTSIATVDNEVIEGDIIADNDIHNIENNIPIDKPLEVSSSIPILDSEQKFSPNLLKRWLIPVAVCVIFALAVLLGSNKGKGSNSNDTATTQDTTTIIQPSTIVQNLNSQGHTPQQSTQTQYTSDGEESPSISPLLYVTTSPTGVLVYVDGKSVGITPVKELPISSGNHTIKLCKEGYKEKTLIRTVDTDVIKINETLTENVKSPSTTASSRKNYTVKGVTFTMVSIPSGTFTMGCSADNAYYEDEKPAHKVTLSSFYIGETEVTQALWQAVMDDNPSYFIGNLQRPVEKVSYKDCKEFIRKLNLLTGAKFRLPTEAEWEYAARGGSKSGAGEYSGGNNLSSLAWCASNSSKTTHAVKGKSPNSYGLYDMSGNVWEWCSDWKSSYSSSPQTNPKGPSLGNDRVIRGGCWNSSAGSCRITHRYGNSPDFGLNNIGLRLAM